MIVIAVLPNANHEPTVSDTEHGIPNQITSADSAPASFRRTELLHLEPLFCQWQAQGG